MKILNISKEQLINFLVDTSIRIGEGSNGIVSIYDNQTLVKIHYLDIQKSYYSNNYDYIDEEIEITGLSKTDLLIELIIKLNKSNSKLIDGIVMYKQYPIGVLMKYYKGYKTLGNILLKLTNAERITIYDKIKTMLYNLVENGIYMIDIKFDNILIDEKSLDVQIIDLDDQETTVRGNDNSKEYVLKKIESFLNLYYSFITDTSKKIR